tara:strand:- start:5419 stop:5967 length:549 start_codon:yes stop_codon:yes gene_type:complete
MSINLSIAKTPSDISSNLDVNNFRDGPNETLECVSPERGSKQLSSLTCRKGSRLKSKSFTGEITSSGEIKNIKQGTTQSDITPSIKIIGVSHFNDILSMQYVSDGTKTFINFEVSMCEYGPLIEAKSTIVDMNVIGKIGHRENPLRNCETDQLISAKVELTIKENYIPVKIIFTVPTADFCF